MHDSNKSFPGRFIVLQKNSSFSFPNHKFRACFLFRRCPFVFLLWHSLVFSPNSTFGFSLPENCICSSFFCFHAFRFGFSFEKGLSGGSLRPPRPCLSHRGAPHRSSHFAIEHRNMSVASCRVVVFLPRCPAPQLACGNLISQQVFHIFARPRVLIVVPKTQGRICQSNATTCPQVGPPSCI